jgi:hypothetical protein
MGKRHARRGTSDYLTDGWRLGGAAIGFVRGDRVLQRFMLGSIGFVSVVSAGAAVAAVALRRSAGPVEYVLVGVAALYLLSLMTTAVGVGLAGLVADSLDGRPLTASAGWRLMRMRRRSIAGWALVDTAVGIPSKAIGSWTVDQLGTLVLGFGWSLLNFFAIPAIALTGSSAWTTARHSLRLVRGHWGDAVYSTVYLWVRAVVLFGVPAAIAVAAGVLLIRSGAELLGGAVFAVGVAGLAVTFLLAQAARVVVTVVLYKFASAGTVYAAFPATLLERSVRGPSSLISRVARRIEGERIRRLRTRVLGNHETGDAARDEAEPEP